VSFRFPQLEPAWGALDDTERRIVAATLELAIQGGYDAVRQRDVAARAGVALATVYSRFRSKDLMLAVAIEVDSRSWMEALLADSLRGRTPQARATKLFERMTELQMRRPQLLRAAMRTAASGDREAMLRQMVGHQRLLGIIADALRGPKSAPALESEPAQRVAAVLVMVWFAHMTNWSAGVGEPSAAVDAVGETADMLLKGVLPRLAP
jgi:TetR/AcrR family transcriptional regulator, cholesterol catabolism regulator